MSLSHESCFVGGSHESCFVSLTWSTSGSSFARMLEQIVIFDHSDIFKEKSFHVSKFVVSQDIKI